MDDEQEIDGNNQDENQEVSDVPMNEDTNDSTIENSSSVTNASEIRADLFDYKIWKENVPYLYDIMLQHYLQYSINYLDWGLVQEGVPQSKNIPTSQYFFTASHGSSRYNESARSWVGPSDFIVVNAVDISRPLCTNMWHLGRFNDYMKNHLVTFCKKIIHPGPLAGIKSSPRNSNILFSFPLYDDDPKMLLALQSKSKGLLQNKTEVDAQNVYVSNIWNVLKQPNRGSRDGIEANFASGFFHHPSPLQIQSFQCSQYSDTMIALDTQNHFLKWELKGLQDSHFGESIHHYSPVYVSNPSNHIFMCCDYFYLNQNMSNTFVTAGKDRLLGIYDERVGKDMSASYSVFHEDPTISISTHPLRENQICTMDENKSIYIYDIRNMSSDKSLTPLNTFPNTEPKVSNTKLSKVCYLSDNPDYIYALTNSTVVNIYSIPGLNHRHKIFTHCGHPITVTSCMYNVFDPLTFISVSPSIIRDGAESNISDMTKMTRGTFLQIWRPQELLFSDLSDKDTVNKLYNLSKN